MNCRMFMILWVEFLKCDLGSKVGMKRTAEIKCKLYFNFTFCSEDCETTRITIRNGRMWKWLWVWIRWVSEWFRFCFRRNFHAMWLATNRVITCVDRNAGVERCKSWGWNRHKSRWHEKDSILDGVRMWNRIFENTNASFTQLWSFSL